jgi:hypothetical protein
METMNQLTEDVPAGPGFGLKRGSFGLSRERMNRVEITLAMRGGGVLNVFDQVDNEVTDERLEEFAAQLVAQIQTGAARTFADGNSATGQRSWVNLAEVTAFTVRQAK